MIKLRDSLLGVALLTGCFSEPAQQEYEQPKKQEFCFYSVPNGCNILSNDALVPFTLYLREDCGHDKDLPLELRIFKDNREIRHVFPTLFEYSRLKDGGAILTTSIYPSFFPEGEYRVDARIFSNGNCDHKTISHFSIISSLPH